MELTIHTDEELTIEGGIQQEIIIERPKLEENDDLVVTPWGMHVQKKNNNLIKPVTLVVWAGKRMKQAIKRVPGVLSVDRGGFAVRYVVEIDPRYNVEWVVQEITAALKCYKPGPKKEKATQNPVRKLSAIKFTLGGTE